MVVMMDSACVRLSILTTLASMLTHGGALGVGQMNQRASEIVIPDWKLELVSGTGDSWWSKFGFQYISSGIASAIWGTGYPAVTGSPAQNHQHCPIIKLPDTFVIAAKHQSWSALHGEWSTNTGVRLASWEQNYLGMGFSRDIKRMSVFFYDASSGQVALRTRYYSDLEMLKQYDWKESIADTIKSPHGTAREEEKFNLGIFDCAGTLMYVVKEVAGFPPSVNLFSREGKLISKSPIGQPVLRYQFVQPSTGYLIATAEAPGINASIKVEDIPRNVDVRGIHPFGFHFEQGGYPNSSALMDQDYRWVLAAGVQALAIYEAQSQGIPWGVITFTETFLIVCMVVAILVFAGLLYCIYRTVFPSTAHEYYGKLADNAFFMQPECPPHKQGFLDAARGRNQADRRYGSI